MIEFSKKVTPFVKTYLFLDLHTYTSKNVSPAKLNVRFLFDWLLLLVVETISLGYTLLTKLRQVYISFLLSVAAALLHVNLFVFVLLLDFHMSVVSP